MGLDKQTLDINGHRWVVRPFPARKALGLKMRLAKAVGPAIAELLPALGTMQAGSADADALGIDLAMLPRAVNALAANLGEDAFVDTIVELMSMASRDDTEITPEYFDTTFAGNYGEMYRAIWFVLKVNYSDFIGMVGNSGIGARLKALQPETPTT